MAPRDHGGPIIQFWEESGTLEKLEQAIITHQPIWEIESRWKYLFNWFSFLTLEKTQNARQPYPSPPKASFRSMQNLWPVVSTRTYLMEIQSIGNLQYSTSTMKCLWCRENWQTANLSLQCRCWLEETSVIGSWWPCPIIKKMMTLAINNKTCTVFSARFNPTPISMDNNEETSLVVLKKRFAHKISNDGDKFKFDCEIEVSEKRALDWLICFCLPFTRK